ncbi:hypothetical protein BKA82DRAFT_1005306, partial [Pisolithus tinctorius]
MTFMGLSAQVDHRDSTSGFRRVIPDFFSENLIRGRALFVRSPMKAWAAVACELDIRHVQL